jgi:hypothetical protein
MIFGVLVILYFLDFSDSVSEYKIVEDTQIA